MGVKDCKMIAAVVSLYHTFDAAVSYVDNDDHKRLTD